MTLPLGERATSFNRHALARRLLAVCALLLFLVTAFAPISMTSGDAQPALLVSQALLESGTIRLDGFEGRLAQPLADDYRTEQHGGHYYYYFPIGSSILALPAVWLARQAGFDMAVPDDNELVQNWLASLVVVAVFLLAHGIASLYLAPLPALFLSLLGVAGSSLVSTVATAFWNVDLAVVCIMLSVWLVLRHEREPDRPARPFWLGLLLVAAYITRPTTATFIVVLLGYLLFWHRFLFWRVAVVAAVGLLLFLLFNQQIYGQWLPPYNSLGRLQDRESGYDRILKGLLFSPSRGFFVFHPHFLLVAAGSLWLLVKGKWRRQQLALWLWVLLTLGVVSQFAHWWGGHSFGPRLLTEIVPAFLVLTVLVAAHVTESGQVRRVRAMATLFLALSLFAVFVHSFQALFNHHTMRWNSYLGPTVDEDPDSIFDWRYPQFLASNDSLCARYHGAVDSGLALRAVLLKPYRPGETIRHAATPEQAYFAGWLPPEPDFRWSACRTVRILFVPTAIDPTASYRLVLSAGSLEAQTVSVSLNQEEVGRLAFPAQIAPPVERGLIVSGASLRPDALNQLTFSIPDARPYPDRFSPHIGISFVSLTIRPPD